MSPHLSTLAPPMEAPAKTPDARVMLERYRAVRSWTETLCEPLAVEDYVVQSMPDASPTKWHLAHTTWFFETLVLRRHLDGYASPEPRYNYLYNSYYNTIGDQWSRPERGLLSRPTVEEIRAYRRHVDLEMERYLEGADSAEVVEVLPVVEVGLNHEQQHQELLLTDLKHMLSKNPLAPVYRPYEEVAAEAVPRLGWRFYGEGLRWTGAQGSSERFSYDNEGPRHRLFLEAFEVADRLVTCGEYLDFMADGGYERAELWLSDGWATVDGKGWRAPLYWRRDGDTWLQFTLAGLRPVQAEEPVCHVSLYEADAYARWAGARLPSETEWEVMADDVLGRFADGDSSPAANLAEEKRFHPRVWTAAAAEGCQLLGDVWEWTRSPYVAYPGYRPPEGALGEYNAKFMNNQTVLRGGSCATPRSHIRSTYRNFFPPDARWQFMGLRLARDAEASP